MLILGVTTSHPECSIAITHDGHTLCEDIFDGKRTCLEELVPRIERMLQGCGLDYTDMDLFAVDRGPGGLTGIKIGIVTVRTLAQMARKPAASCSSLRAMCCGADADFVFPATYCSAKDVYYACFQKGSGLPRRLTPDSLGTAGQAAAEFAKYSTPESLLIGDMAEAVAAHMTEPPRIVASHPPRAAHVCALASAAAHQPWHALQANYLCVTNAESMFAKRKAGS
jgi:tRNA threonylcarbamoyladenosine biosynthesis protein TsaB